MDGRCVLPLARLARIAMVDASRTAKERFSGDILSVALENEDGYLVYAGNGKILADVTKGKHAERGEKSGDY